MLMIGLCRARGLQVGASQIGTANGNNVDDQSLSVRSQTLTITLVLNIRCFGSTLPSAQNEGKGKERVIIDVDEFLTDDEVEIVVRPSTSTSTSTLPPKKRKIEYLDLTSDQ